MIKRWKTVGKIGVLLFLAAALLASCVPQRRIRYFQDKAENGQDQFTSEIPLIYRIKPGDNLFIRIRSIDKEAYSFGDTQGATNYYSSAGVYYNGYSVNETGNINFPLIGDINVEDLTIEEARLKIQAEVDQYVKNTSVVIKLGSYKVAILGEVNRPQQLEIYQDKITIYEAIAMAGDMTDFAKRDKVVLIRQTETGTTKHILDLNDHAMLESEFLYMQPQDVVYVEPVRGKAFVFSNFPYGLVFSTISLALVLIVFFQ